MFQIAHSAAMESGVRLLAPERPGFGISSPHPGRTLASYAADLENVANALGIDKFAIAGISGGGPYAAACAALLPDRVLALGLVSPIGPMSGSERPASIGLGHQIAFCLSPRIPVLMGTLFGLGRLSFLYTPNLIFGFIKMRAAPPDWKILSRSEVRQNLLNGVREGCRPGITASLQEMKLFSRPWNIPFQNITASAFLWQGLSDRNVPITSALRLGELIPNCKVFKIEKAGHYWIFDNIDEVLQTIVTAASHRIV